MSKTLKEPEKKVYYSQRNFSKKQLIDALEASGGLQTKAAKLLETTYVTFKKYLGMYDVGRELKGFEEATLDLAEEKLKEKVKAGDLRAIQFCLKCKGKERGWIEEPEKGNNSILRHPIQFIFNRAKPAIPAKVEVENIVDAEISSDVSLAEEITQGK